MIGVLVNMTSLGIVAGFAGAALVGYCVYFDNKRRSHPDFKKNLHERRRRYVKADEPGHTPNLVDQNSTERYFVQEIQRGEVLIAEGNFEGGADHLMNAIVVCSKPGKLLNVLQKTLPVEVFTLLVYKLNNYNRHPLRSTRTADGRVVNDYNVE